MMRGAGLGARRQPRRTRTLPVVGDGGGGPVTVELPEPTPTSHVVLWFTTLPSTPDGFVVQLYSVTVR